jgi:hypothetical protein
MTNTVPALRKNIASVQAEIKRVRRNLADANIPKPAANSGY